MDRECAFRLFFDLSWAERAPKNWHEVWFFDRKPWRGPLLFGCNLWRLVVRVWLEPVRIGPR